MLEFVRAGFKCRLCGRVTLGKEPTLLSLFPICEVGPTMPLRPWVCGKHMLSGVSAHICAPHTAIWAVTASPRKYGSGGFCGWAVLCHAQIISGVAASTSQTSSTAPQSRWF